MEDKVGTAGRRMGRGGCPLGVSVESWCAVPVRRVYSLMLSTRQPLTLGWMSPDSPHGARGYRGWNIELLHDTLPSPNLPAKYLSLSIGACSLTLEYHVWINLGRIIDPPDSRLTQAAVKDSGSYGTIRIKAWYIQHSARVY